MRSFADSPILLLLQRRHDRDVLGLTLLVSLGICAAAGLFLGWLVKPWMGLVAAALSSLLVVPFVRAQGDSTILAQFLHGGSYDEIRTTRLTAWEMLDAITCHSMLCVLRLSPWLALIGIGLTWLNSPPGWVRYGALGLAVAWLPAMVLASWAQAYLSQMMAVLSHSSWPGSVALGAVLACVLPGVLTAPWVLVLFLNEKTASAVLLLVAGCFWMAGLARLLAGLALERGVPEAWSQRQAQPSSQPLWPRPWSENPIVVRECAREAGRSPEGVASVLAGTLGLGVALVYLIPAVSYGFFQGRLLASPLYWYIVLGFLFLLQPTRAASRITGAIAEERDKRTLEALAVTPLGREEFITGWIQIGCFPRLLELAVAAPGLLILGSGAGVPLDWTALALFLTAVNIWAGAMIGLALGLWATSRRHAIGDMAVFVYVLFGATVTLAATNGTVWLAALGVLGLAVAGQKQGRRLATWWLS